MITEEQAKDMMKKLHSLRKKFKKEATEENEKTLQDYERLCLEKLQYFVLMKTAKYRRFSNYEDLTQEGLEALLKAMKTFNNKKGSFFYWAGLFVNTKLSRSANNHSVIRYPMHIAKHTKPHKESSFPVMLDIKNSPEKLVETTQISKVIKGALNHLDEEQQKLVSMVYGFDGDKPMSIAKVCEKLKITRSVCMKALNNALGVLKENIEL